MATESSFSQGRDCRISNSVCGRFDTGRTESGGTLDVQNASARNAVLSETGSNKRNEIVPLGATPELGQASQTSLTSSAEVPKGMQDTSLPKPKPIRRANRRHPRDHVAPKNHAFVLPRKLVVRAKPKSLSSRGGSRKVIWFVFMTPSKSGPWFTCQVVVRLALFRRSHWAPIKRFLTHRREQI